MSDLQNGIVQEKGASSTGKPKVKINGKWYFAGNCDVTHLGVGQLITYESNTFKTPDGKTTLHGLQNWAVLPVAGSNPPPVSVPAVPIPAAVSNAAPVDGDHLRFCSNVIANAIVAGKITKPSEMVVWWSGALSLLRGEEVFDSEVPY